MKRKVLSIMLVALLIVIGIREIIKLERDINIKKDSSQITNESKNQLEKKDDKKKNIDIEKIKEEIAELEDIKNDKYMLLTNKENKLDENYIPKNLVRPNIMFNQWSTNRTLEKVTANATVNMFQAAKNNGIRLLGISGYRSYKTQVEVFNQEIKEKGSEEKAKDAVAPPGYSEHQTGYVLDLTSTTHVALDEAFDQTRAFKWLQDNCYKYGFILRYPKNKTNVTKYEYEPWHYRYVGVENATYIMKNNLTLEEYIDLINNRINTLKKQINDNSKI